ncbi:phage major capsid protein [Thermoanaerobacterium thermosaccharolyticum]|uniref:phage major capsid protein n=1 Tax=Thermoanaerobacterium thermosaccharolyticum TaxID=1517 RepID=UPI003DA7FDE6
MDDKVLELQNLIKEMREKFEAKEKGLYTKAEFEEFEAKINERIAQLETMIKRPPMGDNGTKDNGQPSERKSAFFKFMREGKSVLTPEEQKALVSDATGQILIPEELESEIYRELPKLTIIRSLATVRQTRSDRIRRRSLTEVTVGWGKLETGSTLTESTMTPDDDYQYVEDLYGLTKIGEDELMDTDVALESITTDSFSRAIAEAEDTAFVIGTGHANKQPEGILNGTVVSRVNAGQVGAITADDILKLIYEVPAQYRQNGVLIVNSKTELAMRLLKDSNGQYLWQPSLQTGRPNSFAGYPVYNQEDIPDIPSAGTAADVAIFGDIRSGYRIIDRLGMTVQRLVELYAESGLVGFKAHYRVGGGVIRPDALRILNVPAA